MGDLDGIALSMAALTPTEKAIGLVTAIGVVAATIVFLAKPRRSSRPQRTYDDPGLKETRRLPRESMNDVVWERRR